MSKAHVNDVARLHCASLEGLLSKLGVPAAKAFYDACVRTESAVGFVCFEESSVRGYVLGSAHPDRLRREVLRRNPVGTLTGLCLGIVVRPSALGWLIRSFRGPDEGSYDDRAAELTYLAVAPDCRSGGIGRRLVDAFTQAIREAGAEAYELSVDEDNQPAIDFYERLNFRLIGHYREFGMVHRRYRLELLSTCSRRRGERGEEP